MNANRHWLGLLLYVFASACVAASSVCQPWIAQAWVRAAPPGATVLAAYATVKNPCANAAAITSVAGSDFGMAMIHETTMVNGMSGMRHVEALSISAKGEVRFAPGASHIMLMQPKREFHEGDKTRLTFHLADGRVISADFVVRREAP